MPTIPQLPMATSTGTGDELVVSQGGIARSVTVAELLSGAQPVIELASGSLLGRASLGPGGPEAIPTGVGIAIENASVIANGGDHATYPEQTALTTTDEVILNSNGIPKRLGLPLLRGLFSAGDNVAIDGGGDISASTDPSVTSELGSLTSQLAAADANIAALAAKIPSGGFAGLNAEGQLTNATVGPVSLGTVMVASGAPSRTVQARALDSLNVLDFGAVPGAADSTSGFNAAFAALPANGGEIFIPAGDYTLASPLLWSGKSVAIRGAGKGISRLHMNHTGIGFDIAPTSGIQRVVLRDFSAYPEDTSGQTAAVARITYPPQPSFGYVTTVIRDVECFGYPNPNNGMPPFPQTFLRGFVLNGCWSSEIDNVSWFGPPAQAGTSSSAVIEVNQSFDTRITGLQAYYGHAAVLQTGYCEGVYFNNPLIVGTDYLMTQTDETTWPGYAPNKSMLLGLWITHGEINIALAALKLDNVSGGFLAGLDISRDGGPNTAQTLFDFTNVSNFYIVGLNINGGPSGGNHQDVGLGFVSTWDSSGNTLIGCSFGNMTTAINIGNVNATVGLVTAGLNLGNVPAATALIDNSGANVGNYVTFVSPATGTQPAGIANTKDHLWTNPAGNPLFRINTIAGAANFIRHQPATHSNPPTLCFDGSDGQVNGTIQTKGGNLYLNAAGSSGNGDLLDLLNNPGATNWIEIQNATSGNLCQIGTNFGGIGIQPSGALWLSPTGGLFAPNLPTSKPASGSHQLWNNGGVLSVA